jgi:predicted ribosomally synthesized peptide with nif11-like leader
MSKENLEQFIQQISDSGELQTRIGDEIDTDAFIALGAEHGCDFTAEDLHAELSDEELDGVAGGLAMQSSNGQFRIVPGGKGKIIGRPVDSVFVNNTHK